MKNITVSIVLYKSKILKNGDHPLMLRIIQKRKSIYKAIGISCPLELWDEQKGRPKRSHPDKFVLESIIDKRIADYKAQIFVKKKDSEACSSKELMALVENPSQNINLLEYIDSIIYKLKQSGNIGNATAYKDTKRILTHFLNQRDIPLANIDFSFVTDFEHHLRVKSLSEVSISVYFRTLRAIINKAINDNILRQESYPFKKFKISKFNTETKKRAIHKEEVQKIVAYNCTNENLLLAKYCFLFSYYGNGINFIDIANLKWCNINKERVTYTRAKTHQILSFKLLSPSIEILNHYKVNSISHTNVDYIFPILEKEKHVTPEQIDNRIKKMRKAINKGLKEIGNAIGLKTELTTYVARHTFATVLKRNLISTSLISEAMGHTSEITTRTYLKSFENEVMDTAVESLL